MSIAQASAIEKLLYTRKHAAVALDISLRTLDTLLADKALQTRRIRGRVMIPASELRRFVRRDTFAHQE